jgi:hypothetical protein
MSSAEIEETDSEDIFIKADAPDDVSSLLTSPGGSVFKIASFIFILFILVCSDVFVEKILSSSTNTLAKGRYPTTQGTLVQGVIVSLGYVVLHALVTSGYL